MRDVPPPPLSISSLFFSVIVFCLLLLSFLCVSLREGLIIVASTNILIIFHGPVASGSARARRSMREDDSDFNALSLLFASLLCEVFTGLSSVTVLVSFLCLPSQILTLSIVNLQFSAVLHHLLPSPFLSLLSNCLILAPLSVFTHHSNPLLASQLTSPFTSTNDNSQPGANCPEQ